MRESDKSEISINEIVYFLKSIISYLVGQWWKILLVAVFTAAGGYYYAAKQPIKYNAKLSFVVEENKSNATGLASLAGQFGFDVGSNTNNSLLYGENLLLFLKSSSLIRSVLLSVFDKNNPNISLADIYVQKYNELNSFSTKKTSKSLVSFPPSGIIKYSREQDSLLQEITKQVISEITIERPEKKATFVLVQVNMKDEILSKLFCERIVSKAIERFIFFKTSRQKTNVDRLQVRADSIASLLNNKTYNTASLNDKLLDINPAYNATAVPAEVSGRDKMLLGTIYSEIIKNLEIAKVQLSQETPTIQIIDEVNLPLKILKKNRALFFVAGFFIGIIISLFLLIIIHIMKKTFNTID